MPYQLTGNLLEVCTCKILCPCWVGEDPDGGTCDSSLAYHIDKGEIDGVDVAGLTWVNMVHIPGNVLHGNWRVINYVDAGASDAQFAALVSLFHGKLGGPLADVAQLFGEIIEVRRAPITFEVAGGKGRFTVGDVVKADLEPYLGPTGQPTVLQESIFSTIPGSPAYVGKALRYRQKSPELKQDIDLQGHNAISGPFRFEHGGAKAA
jgi:hypothetical protein